MNAQRLSERRYLPPKIERIPIYLSRQEPICVVHGMRAFFRHTEEKPFWITMPGLLSMFQEKLWFKWIVANMGSMLHRFKKVVP